MSNALKLAIHYSDPLISHARYHKITSRATPQMYSDFKLALLQYKTFNNRSPETEWVELNFAQSFSSRQTLFHVNKTNRLQIGLNNLCNRFHYLNDKIPLEWLNKSYLAYKLDCKEKF